MTSTRRRFRPRVDDLLEERTLPSAVTVGALGDSYTGEYYFHPPYQSQARNWVEILWTMRNVGFGAFNPQGWGWPRNKGFAFNWARGGATSIGMVQQQLPGLAAQVALGQVQYVSIFIGSNDFNWALQDAVHGTMPPALALDRMNATEQVLEANVQTAVTQLRAANPNVKIVLTTLFDVSLMPCVGRVGPAGQPVLQAMRQAIAGYNAFLTSLAAGDSRLGVLDLAGLVTQLVQEAGPRGWAPFGHTVLNVRRAGEDLHDLFLADGIHFGTVFQGVLANAFVEAIDHLGATVRPLSPEAIVHFAANFLPDTP